MPLIYKILARICSLSWLVIDHATALNGGDSWNTNRG